MGETQNQLFQLSFNASLRVDFQGSRVTSDGGLILIRELDERLGLGELIEQYLTDSRPQNARLDFADLLQQSVYSRLAGYEDVNDAERLCHDPTFRLIGSEKIWDRRAALTSRLQTFETEMLAEEENFAGLARLNRALLGRAEAMDSTYRAVLDMDSTEIPVYFEAHRKDPKVWHGLVDNDQRQASYLAGDELAELKFWLGDEGAEAAVAAAATGPVGVPAPTGAATAASPARQRIHAVSARAAHGPKARG